MASEPDVTDLHQEIDQTRADLTEKLETLETQVRETVLGATENVGETIENVTSTVQETVENVKRTFDLRYQVQERPWMMVGGAVVAGLVVGAVVARQSRGSAWGPPPHVPHGFTGLQPSRGEPAMSSGHQPPAPQPAQPSFLGGLAHQFEPEIGKVKELAIGFVAGLLRDWVKQAVPAFKQQIDEVMNSATTKLGGEPAHGPVFGASSGGAEFGRQPSGGGPYR
jgi:ElaB/YqjD/DUF883 family membrane-anchored ribosome-binding protein